ncbi:UDP-glucuronosyltransferase 2B30 [Agrilus planipennis]|uniref:UDP-glucuronosyltransferase 2B30 n=1 Tax=Agrilus planipennis TaxID=224129 RepID=A0A1W4WMF4_AGRPL|nr:UDP-glucuronosyltransferase 2B30 [Agrilus planipennis]
MVRACVLILCTLPLFTNGLKILGLFSHSGKSHHQVFEPLLVALSEKGHDVTVISFFPQEKPRPRFKDISLTNLSMPGSEVMNVDTKGSRIVKYKAILLIKMFADSICGPLLSSPQVQNFLKGDLSYDVILIEFFNSNCMMAIVEKVKAPTIGLSSCVVMPHWNDHFGNPDNPSYIPLIYMDYSDQLSFLERVENTVIS